MKRFLAMFAAVLVVFTSGCLVTGVKLPPYLENPANIAVLSTAASTCLLTNPNAYGAGVLYIYDKSVDTTKASSSQIEAAIQCGGNIWTVQCDVTKSAKDNPCKDLRTWAEVK